MKLLQLALCDDNSKFLAVLQEMIESISRRINRNLKLGIHCFAAGKELIDSLASGNRYDLIILDWDMPGLSGADTGKAIRDYDHNCLIIFITAFSDYAIQASRLTTFRYITKDRIHEDLPEALYAAYDKYLFNDITIQLKETNENTHLIRIKDIVAIENNMGKTTIVIKHNKKYYAPRSFLSNHSDMLLQNGFIKPYKGILINIREILHLNQMEIIMKNGYTVPMSRNYKKDVFIRIQKYMEAAL